MKITLNIQDDLLRKAMELSGIQKKTEVVRAGLEALIQKLVAERLIALGGCDPHATAGRRRRSRPRGKAL